MEPPTCTVLVRLVRTTAPVAIELVRPDDEATVWLPLVDATATPPATAPPTRAPAMAAMATTRRVENSAMGGRDLCGAGPAVGSCAARGGAPLPLGSLKSLTCTTPGASVPGGS